MKIDALVRAFEFLVTNSDLTESEAAEVAHVFVAVTHATTTAERLSGTLDGRVRALLVTKLQEAQHWCLELTRTESR